MSFSVISNKISHFLSSELSDTLSRLPFLLTKMELCRSATAAPTLLKFKPFLCIKPFSPSSSISLLQNRPLSRPIRGLFFDSSELLPTSLPSLRLKKNSSPFVASASTAVVGDATTIEKLPADLKVTEIHEPNSRVSS